MRRQTTRNSLALLISQAVTVLVTALMLPFLTRYLGKAGYGLYTSIYAFVGTFGILGDIGLNVILNREIARRREQAARLLGQTLVLKLLLGLLFLVVVMAAATSRALGPFDGVLLLICALGSGIRTFANTMIVTSRAHEAMGYETVVTLLDRATWVGGIALVIWLDLGLAAVFLVFLFAAVVRLTVALFICYRRICRPRPGADLSLWRFMLGEAWAVGLGLGARRIQDRIGTVQLTTASDAATVGLFSGPNRVYGLTNSLITTLPDALFPGMAAAAGASQDRLRWIALSGLKTLLLVTFPLAAFYAAFAPDFVPWFLGPDFRESAPVLQVLAAAVVLTAVNTLLSSLLRASGRQRYDLVCLLAALATNFSLNLLLIPRFGHVGPAVAVVFSQAVQSVLALAGTFPQLRRLPARSLFAPMLSASAMVGAWWLARPLPLVVRLGLGPVVYGVALVLLGGIDRGTVRLVKGVLSQCPAARYVRKREGPS